MRSLFTPLQRFLLQLLLLLLCYFISRSVFTLLNLDRFNGLSITGFLQLSFSALRYDVSALLTINALYLILLLLPLPAWKWPRWQRFTQLLFISTNILALSFEVSDWAYFGFTLKRSTVDVLDMVGRKGDFWALLPHFLKDYWYVPLGLILLSIVLTFVNKWICRITPLTPPAATAKGKLVMLWQSVLLIIVLGLCLIGIRGGLQLVPIGIQNALQVTENSKVPVVLNTPFSIMHSYSGQKMEELHYYSDSDIKKYINPIKRYGNSGFRSKNVVYIIVESLSKQFTGLGGRKSYTPFLDSLMQHSYSFGNAYANALRSAEGIPAVISGVPSLMEEPITTSFYATTRLTSLPQLLKDQGYQTAFYHGGTNGTMSFDIYASNAGFSNYYGRKEYNNEDDYDGNWGIWDEPFLQYFADGLSGMKQPFMAAVFTLTSHDPFKVPEQYKDILPSGDLPVEKCLAYTDQSLKKFFEKASRQPWFQNTVFVITADHCSPMTKDEYYSSYNMGIYAIPIILYAPGDPRLVGRSENVMQQIDILPTVLDYLQYDKPFFALGNSAFRKDAPGFVINEQSGSYQWFMQDFLMTTKGMAPSALYDFRTDSLCRNNLIEKNREGMEHELLPYFRAFVQLYRSSLIHNKMNMDHIGYGK